MSIRITSDSTCDLGHLVAERNIGILPLQVNLDADSFYDGVDITPEDIFKFVEEKKILPKTSAPSIGDYEEFFAKELQGYDELIHFNISSKSSGSHNMAKQAAESFNGKVRVVDSMALSSGQGLLVLKAADMRDAGNSADEIVAAVEELRTRVNTSFIPDSLDYLHKGGRVSGMVKLAAGLFKIHPLIMMDNGQLVPGKKYKGKMSVIIKQYVDDLYNMYPNYDKTRCFVTHSTADPELVAAAKEKVQELFKFDEVIETVAGSIVTSHCGKNTLGVLFVYNK
ncbi:MAG: DegV family protein [Clostridia bacterium]|nr:DegV family protein [Clostridia bacterium]MBQ8446477.1 DegV family protein [Clostridia bacterium]MBQ8447286.1 DegV family protein [Clostridia bacterium]